MGLRPEYTLQHPRFEDFLFSVVGEEQNGMQLTVLSALARLDLDPWAEAARLSELTRDAAIRALQAALARLPGAWPPSDRREIAVRLADQLPGRAAPSAARDRAEAQAPRSAPLNWLLGAAAGGALVVLLLLLG